MIYDWNSDSEAGKRADRENKEHYGRKTKEEKKEKEGKSVCIYLTPEKHVYPLPANKQKYN